MQLYYKIEIQSKIKQVPGLAGFTLDTNVCHVLSLLVLKLKLECVKVKRQVCQKDLVVNVVDMYSLLCEVFSYH